MTWQPSNPWYVLLIASVPIPTFFLYITDIGECVTDGVDHCAGGGMCKWKDGKYQCVCATNGIDYCTGEDAECRNIGGVRTCICVDGYQGYHGDCRGLVLKNVYSMMYSFLLFNHNINCLTLTCDVKCNWKLNWFCSYKSNFSHPCRWCYFFSFPILYI